MVDILTRSQVFNPSDQYGDFVVVGVENEHSELGDEVRKQAIDALTEQFRGIIPSHLHPHVKILERGPVWMEDPLKPPGPDNGAWAITVAWKYTPAKSRVGVVNA